MNGQSRITIARLVGGLALLGSTLIVNADSSYSASSDMDASVHCMCVVAKPGCDRVVWNAISGSERQSWFQTAHLIAGKTYNLDEICYRKRNAEVSGAGTCCEGSDQQDSIKRLFRGEIK
jgi:hypothetical protein